MALHIQSENKPDKTRQLYWALLVLALYAVYVVALYGYLREGFYTAVSGFAFGYILQRSRFCFAAGFRDVFMIRNTAVTRAIILLLFLSSIGFFFVQTLKAGLLPDNGIIYPVGIHTIAGGLIFGFGLVIAGNCVSGCLMRMGEGYLMQWFTFLGLLVGSGLGAWNLRWWGPQFIEKSPTLFLPDVIGWPLTLTAYISIFSALYFFAYWYERGSIKGSLNLKISAGSLVASSKSLGDMVFAGKNWSYALGAVALSLVNTLTFFHWGRPAGITSGLTHLVGWASCRIGFAPCDWYYFQEQIYFEGRRIYLEHPLLLLSAGIIIGSLFASLLHREFRIRRPKSYKFAYSALAGGILLGYSSRVAMGCNFGGFWSGISSFSLHAWVFGIFIFVGAYFGGKFFMRYLV